MVIILPFLFIALLILDSLFKGKFFNFFFQLKYTLQRPFMGHLLRYVGLQKQNLYRTRGLTGLIMRR